jgi:hypothetical protein
MNVFKNAIIYFEVGGKDVFIKEGQDGSIILETTSQETGASRIYKIEQKMLPYKVHLGNISNLDWSEYKQRLTLEGSKMIGGERVIFSIFVFLDDSYTDEEAIVPRLFKSRNHISKLGDFRSPLRKLKTDSN